jgi:hypothetical protein
MVYHCLVRQRLCTRVDPGLGQGSAERVPQRVRVPGGNISDLAVVAEDPPQPLRGQRLAPMPAPWPR